MARRIAPANLADLPSVLDTQETANVLRVSVERVRELANSGDLERLDYTRDFLFAAFAVRRYLREHSIAVVRSAGGDAA
jgi:hypothetical protein